MTQAVQEQEPTAVDQSDLVGAILAALALELPDLQFRARLANWTLAKFRAEMGADGRWQDRFAADLAAVTTPKVNERCTRILGKGLAALADRDMGALLALLPDTEEPAVARARRTLRAFCAGYDPALQGGRLLLAPTGLGKSVACVAVMRRRCEVAALTPSSQGSVDRAFLTFCSGLVWVRAYDLPNARLEQKLGDGEAELIEKAAAASFLVIDDMGWESRRANADDVIGEVIAERYDAGRITCVTSGLRLDQFTERYGEAIVRRITEAGGLPGKVLDLWPRESKQ